MIRVVVVDDEELVRTGFRLILQAAGDLEKAWGQVKLAVEDVTAEFADPFGGRRVGASARTKVRRSDFNMKWNAALEAGGVLVGDEIAIQIEVELVRQ